MHYEYLGEKGAFILGAIIGLFKWGWDASRYAILGIHFQADFSTTLVQGILLAGLGGAAGWVGRKVMMTAWYYTKEYFDARKKRRGK